MIVTATRSNAMRARLKASTMGCGVGEEWEIEVNQWIMVVIADETIHNSKTIPHGSSRIEDLGSRIQDV